MKNIIVVALAFAIALAAGCARETKKAKPSMLPPMQSSKTTERSSAVTMQGKHLTLVGPALRVGDRAPDFQAVDQKFSTVSLEDLGGQVLVIFSLPSLDTEVCKTETTYFNKEADNLPSGIRLVAISTDLPFAQARFCGTLGDMKVEVLSDAVWNDFGKKYGVLIKDMGLLARAVFVVDKSGKITYIQLVPDTSQEPDYEAAIAAAKAALEEK